MPILKLIVNLLLCLKSKVGLLKKLILIWKFRVFALKMRLLFLWIKFGRDYLGWSKERQNDLFYDTADRLLAHLEKAENKLSSTK